jgi:hypothetical protein
MRGLSFPATSTEYGCIYVSYCQDATAAEYGAALHTLEGISSVTAKQSNRCATCAVLTCESRTSFSASLVLPLVLPQADSTSCCMHPPGGTSGASRGATSRWLQRMPQQRGRAATVRDTQPTVPSSYALLDYSALLSYYRFLETNHCTACCRRVDGPGHATDRPCRWSTEHELPSTRAALLRTINGMFQV